MYSAILQIVLDFLSLSDKVNIGGNNVRAVLGTYDAQPHVSDDFFSLNAKRDYNNKIFEIYEEPETGVIGNNIDEYAAASFININHFCTFSALKSVINLTTVDHGYRVGQNVMNMVVIISSTGYLLTFQ